MSSGEKAPCIMEWGARVVQVLIAAVNVPVIIAGAQYFGTSHRYFVQWTTTLTASPVQLLIRVVRRPARVAVHETHLHQVPRVVEEVLL